MITIADMAPRAVLCPTCEVRFGYQCRSTGGGNPILVPIHAARRNRVSHWSDGQRRRYGGLVHRYAHKPWDAPADLVAEAEAAATPIPVVVVNKVAPADVDLTEPQVRMIEYAVACGGAIAVSTAHLQGDHRRRQTVQALTKRGILVEGPLLDDGWDRRYTLTKYGWLVYRDHPQIVRRHTVGEITALMNSLDGSAVAA